MALLNTIQIRLDAVVAPLQKGLADASKSLNAFFEKNKTLGQTLENVKGKILAINPAAALAAGAVIGIGIAASKAISGAIELADSLNVVAQRTGESVETLSQLKFVAEQNNVEFGALQGTLRILNRNIGQAASGGKTAAAGFKALGVDVRDANGTVKQGSVVLEEVFAELSKIPDAATRTSKGTVVLGRTMSLVMPLIGVDIKAARAEADRFGATISTKFAQQADAYKDNLAKIKTIQQGLGVQLAQVVVPVLNKLLLTILPIAQQAIPLFAGALSALTFLLDKDITIVRLFSTAVFGAWSALRGDRNGLQVAGERFDELTKRLFQSKTAFDAETAAALAAIPAMKKVGTATGEAKSGVSGLDEALQGLIATQDLTLKQLPLLLNAGRLAAEARKKAIEAEVGRIKPPPTALEEIRAGQDITTTEKPLPVPELDTGLPKMADDAIKVRDIFGEIRDVGAQTFGTLQSFAGGFGEAIISTATGAKQAFGDFFKGLLRQIAAAIARALILRALLSFTGLGGLIGKFQGFLKATPFETPSFDAFAKSEGTRFGMLFATGARGSLASTALAGIAARGPGVSQTVIQPQIVVRDAGPLAKVEWFERGQEQRLRRRQTELGGEAL